MTALNKTFAAKAPVEMLAQPKQAGYALTPAQQSYLKQTQALGNYYKKKQFGVRY